MRNTAKKLAGAVIALAMAASLSMTALAADYGYVPVYGGTATTAPAVETSELKSAVTNAVSEAISSGSSDKTDKEETAVAKVEVASVAKLPVAPSIIRELAKSDNAVLEIVSPKVTVSIDASTITKARKVDLSMKVGNTAKQSTIKFTTRNKKDFGCEVKIVVTDCKLSAAKLKKAKVYCDGVEIGPVELDEDGNPIIIATKPGTYVIK